MPLTLVTDIPPRPLLAQGRFDNSYARLPQRLYARLTPTPVRSPRLVQLNAALAEAAGRDHVAGECRGDRGPGRESRARVG